MQGKSFFLEPAEGTRKGPEPVLSLVLPAFNESKKIESTLQNSVRFLERSNFDWELIVVDDGSTDGTEDIIRRTSHDYPQLVAVRNEQNRGKGYAVKSGIRRTRGRYVGFMDADYKTDISCLTESLEKLMRGCDIVIGSRTLKESVIENLPKRSRQIGSRLFNLEVQLMFPALRRFKDTQCGFKLFQRHAARGIFSRLVVDRFTFDVEILHLASLLNYQVCEVPVRWASDPDTRTKLMESILRNLFDLARIRGNHRHP